jgi:Clp amino terminal domain, pathogenicity island component
MAKATTVRFSDEVYARLDQASARTGMPVNSIVVAACLEWMQRHTPEMSYPTMAFTGAIPAAPRWATIRRAVEAMAGASVGTAASPMYPFERFTKKAQGMLTAAQAEAQKSGFNYIGTEHLLLAAFADPTSQSAIVLASLGVHEQTVRLVIEEKLQRAKRPPGNPQIVPTSRVKKVIELAFRLCGAAGDTLVSTGHILLALATEGEGIAAHVMNDAGAGEDAIEAAMESVTEPEA